MQNEYGWYDCLSEDWLGTGCGWWDGVAYCSDWQYQKVYMPGYECTEAEDEYYNCTGTYWEGSLCYVADNN